MMDRLWDGIFSLSRFAVWCGAAMLLIAASIVTTEIALRKMLPATIDLVGELLGFLGSNVDTAANQAWFRQFTFSGSDEIAGYLFAVGTSWSMAYVLCTRGHIRIDALYSNFSPRVRGWLDLMALLALGIFVAAMVYRAWDVTIINFLEYNRSNTNLRIPLAWAQIPWLAGFILFAVAIVVAVLRTFVALVSGDYAKAASIAGVATQDEEIESEMKSLGIQRPQH
jgi:TRAP-type C4-dicarboxylate transport system permease small subunit